MRAAVFILSLLLAKLWPKLIFAIIQCMFYTFSLRFSCKQHPSTNNQQTPYCCLLVTSFINHELYCSLASMVNKESPKSSSWPFSKTLYTYYTMFCSYSHILWWKAFKYCRWVRPQSTFFRLSKKFIFRFSGSWYRFQIIKKFKDFINFKPDTSHITRKNRRQATSDEVKSDEQIWLKTKWMYDSNLP